LVPTVRVAGLNPKHFPRELAAAFAVAIAGDRDQVSRTVKNGSNEVGRLYRLGVERWATHIVLRCARRRSVPVSGFPTTSCI
jgi:hypothetical protein